MPDTKININDLVTIEFQNGIEITGDDLPLTGTLEGAGTVSFPIKIEAPELLNNSNFQNGLDHWTQPYNFDNWSVEAPGLLQDNTGNARIRQSVSAPLLVGHLYTIKVIATLPTYYLTSPDEFGGFIDVYAIAGSFEQKLCTLISTSVMEFSFRPLHAFDTFELRTYDGQLGYKLQFFGLKQYI